MQNIAGLMAAVYITWLLLFEQSAPLPPSRPTTLDLKDFGVAALHRWLDAGQIPVQSWQLPWFDLADSALPPEGNLLLTTLPHDVHAADGEVDALLEWVRQGNTLILNAALNDTPTWIMAYGNEMLGEIETLTGVSVSEVEQEEHAGNTPTVQIAGATLYLDPVDGHPLMAGVHELVFFTDTRTEFWLPSLSGETPLLMQAATERSTRAPGIWEMPRGKGHIIVMASSSLFSNKALQNDGNVQLIRNLVGLRLRGKGVWLFDDYRLGIGAFDDPSRFYRDERLWHSVGFLLAGWFIYLLTTGGRLTKPRPADSRPRLGDHIKAMGGLLARKLDQVTVGRQMLAIWAKEQRAADNEATDPWSRLDAQPTFDKDLLAALKRDASLLAAGKPVPLRELHNRLRKARQSSR
jgi:Domain of unknown function (DUF4350)